MRRDERDRRIRFTWGTMATALASLLVVPLTPGWAPGESALRLTSSAGDDDEPCFSPDGKWIVYQSRDRTGRPDLWVVPSTGGQSRRLTDGAGYKCFPSWSPDGKRIVFASDPLRDWAPDTRRIWMGAYDLYAIEDEGGNWSRPKRLTDTPEVMEYLPAYSPDGARIAYSCAVPGSYRLGDMGVSVMAAQGEPARIERSREGAEGAPATFRAVGRKLVTSEHGAIEPTWSRDGKILAFARLFWWAGDVKVVYNNQVDIRLVPVSTELVHADDTHGLTPYEGYPHFAPAFSPVADLLAFVMSMGEAWDLWVLPAPYETSTAFRLTEHPSADTSPAWSPDGKRIAFASNRDGNLNIYVMDVPAHVLAAGGGK